MAKQTFRKKNDSRVDSARAAVGEPLFLGEASFLVNELKTRGIWCDIHSDLTREGSAVHSVMVEPENLVAAMTIKAEILGENQHDKSIAHSSRDSKKRFTKALIVGILGFAVGARLCLRFKNSVWLFILPPLLGGVSFGIFFCLTNNATEKESGKR